MGVTKRETSSFVLNHIDTSILSFLAFWGVCEESHLLESLNTSQRQVRLRLNYLQKCGLINKEALFSHRSPTLQLTILGAKKWGVKPKKSLSLSDYFHEMTVIDVFLGFCKRYPDAIWVSSRGEYIGSQGNLLAQSRGEFFFRDSARIQIPDGYLFFSEDRCVAVEVELTLKNKRRRDEIFKNYAISLDINEVWYVCPPHIEQVLKRQVREFPFIQFVSLQEIYSCLTYVSDGSSRGRHYA